MSGLGDYLEIAILQPGTGTSTTVSYDDVITYPLHENTIYRQVSPLISRICGSYWNANPTAQTSHATACTFAHPFKVVRRWRHF